MNFNPEQIQKAKAAASAAELLEIAKAEGVELTAEEAEQYFKFLHDSRKLTDEELEQVAGGSRRTDDPEQADCHICFNFAQWYVEEESQTLTPAYKAELLGKINYVWDRTLSWHLADPFELLPIVEQIIAMLETVKDQEAPLYNAWVKMKASIPYLEEMKRKS